MSPQPHLSPGTFLGPYEIVSLLGAGGMGEVYRARDPRLEREIAIKVLPEALASDPDRLRRFRDEALTVSRLNHPNIVQVHDIGEQDGVRFVAMELIDGQTFGSLLASGAFPWERLKPLAQQVLEGLVKAHGASIVHRDLKTENLMVSEDGYVKILDFGLAKQFEIDEDLSSQGTRVGAATTPGMALGTLGYMSPEQAKGLPADHRADQFSFAVVLYEMATGERPFRRETLAESFAALISEASEPLENRGTDLPEEICSLVMRCLSKNPDERYATTPELLEAFREASSDVPTRAASGPLQDMLEEPALEHRSPLAGRDGELAQLVSHLDRAIQGKGALVTLVGEPGVGKTRLTEELAQLAREQGCITLLGNCYEGEGAPPYSPWLEILERTGQISDPDTLRDLLGDGGAEVAKIYPELRQLVPDLPPPLELPPDQSRPYLFRCFREFLERAAMQKPTVLFLEDLHWADDATLLLLEHVAAHLKEIPLLVVGTYRDVDLEVSRPLAKTLQQLVRMRLVEKIALQRLPEEAVARMLEGLANRSVPAPLVSTIHQETEGNPFFIEEVYLHLEEEGQLFDSAGEWRSDLSLEEIDVPEGVRLVVGRRLERLSVEEQKALVAAAVMGRRFSYELLEATTGAEPDLLLDAVEHAEQLKLIEPVIGTGKRRGLKPLGAGYRFSHELIRQTLLSGLSLPRLQRLHLRVANSVEATSPDPGKQASALAHHLYQAGAAADEEKTLRYLILAGEQALASGAFEDALRHFEDAISLVEDEPLENRADLLHLRGVARYSLGRWTEAFADMRDSMPVLAQRENWEELAELGYRCLVIAWWHQLYAVGLEVAKQVLDALPDEDGPHQARVLSAKGAFLGLSGDFDSGNANIRQAMAMINEVETPQIAGEVLWWHNVILFNFMLRAEGAEVLKRAIELFDRAGDDFRRVEAEALLSTYATTLGRPDLLPDSFDDALALAQRLGNQSAHFELQHARANWRWMITGDHIEYEQRIAQIFEADFGTDNPQLTVAQCLYTLYRFWRGEWEGARDQILQVENRLQGNPQDGLRGGLEFLYECYLGDEQAARTALKRYEGRLPTTTEEPVEMGRYVFLAYAVEGLAVLQAREEAAALYPFAEAALRTGNKSTQFAERLFETVAGIAAAAVRRWDVAEQHFEEALRQADEIPFKSEQAEARRFYASMLIERDQPGDRAKAEQLLEQAAEVYREIGMSRHLGLVEAELERLAR